MFDKLIFLIPVLTLVFFALNIFYKGNTVQSYLLFVLAFLPVMDLKITSEAWGGFKTFDAICFYALIFLFKDFIIIDFRNRNNVYVVLFVALAIVMLLSGLASEHPDLTYLNVLKLLPVFIFGRFFLTECLRDPAFHWKAINALKVSYLAALSFLFIQTIVGLKFTFYPGLAPNTVDPVFHIVRYPGIFFDSQASGQYLAMGSFLFLYVKEGSKKSWYVLNYAVFILAVFGISLAGSRAAFGGFAVGMLLVFLMAAKQYRIYGSIIMVLGIFAYTLISPNSGVFDRSENLSSDYLFRQSIWKEALEISKKQPVLGIGWGNYKSYTIRHVQDQYIEVADGELVYFDQPENGYLKIIVELGYLGFLIFSLLIVIPIIKGIIMYFKGIVDEKITFLLACLISYLIAFSTVYTLWDNRLLLMVASMIILIIAYPPKKYLNYG